MRKSTGIHTVLAAALVAMSIHTALSPEAAAAIRCNGAYQVLKNGNEIATPYCEDGYLAKVAQSYGIRVSASTIRHNPNRKQEICQHIGTDIRISHICAGLREDGYGRW